MRHLRFLKPLFIVVVLAGLATAAYFTSDRWRPLFYQRPTNESVVPAKEGAETAAPTGKVLLSDQAIANLGLTAKQVQPRTFWRTIQVPGMVVDRPGQSDRGVVAPATGVVATINQFPSDTVRPGNVLFTLKLLSESLHLTQSDLFKTSQEIVLAKAQRKRLAASSGAIPEARVIEAENQITRLEVAAKAYRQELLTRGLSPAQIEGIALGNFISEILIVVPPGPSGTVAVSNGTPTEPISAAAPVYEIQELRVELGQQVQAGQTLCVLANHHLLAIEGRAFRDETPLLERSVKEGWPVEVDFQEDAAGGWPPRDQTFRIRHLANTIDPATRTFAFLMPLKNESRTVEQDGRIQMLWRFRPGQKVRLLVRVERLDNVLVLPGDAVARDGVEAFVFTQNVNTFERKPVRVILQDRQHAVLTNDGSLPPGTFVAQNGAAQLNRLAKTQSNSTPKGFHIHADGSLHKNEDESK